MPYKSDSQRKLFHVKLSRGEIKPSVVKEFDEASKGMKLPEYVNDKPKYPRLKKYLKGE